MKRLILILALSALVCVEFLIVTNHPMMPDSYGYNAIAMNIAEFGEYMDVKGQVTMDREPAYPLFLAALYSLFGRSYLPVQIAQILLFLLTVLFVYKTAETVFDKRTAGYVLIMTAFFPTLANYPSYILSETLFTFLLSVFVFSCVRLYATDKMLYYFLAGLFLGLSSLCKAVMLPFIAVLAIWVVSVKVAKPRRLRLLVNIVVLLLAFAVSVLPWMLRNERQCGQFGMRAGSEKALAIKAQKLDYTFDDFKRNIAFTISERMGKRLFPDAADNPRDFLFKEDIMVENEILPQLEKDGYSSVEIRDMMMFKILRRPVKYLAVSLLDLFRMTQFTYVPLLIDQKAVIAKIQSFSNGHIILSALRGVFRLLAYLLIVFSVLGMVARRDIWGRWLFLLLLICYTNIIYSLIYGHGRYGVPIIPYYLMLSAPFLVSINEKIKVAKKCQR